MKVSYEWLNEFLKQKAPKPEKLVELLTMHSMDVESVEKMGSDFVIDAKATPNLNHSCLCHRGIAREIATIDGIKTSNYSREFKDFSISKTAKNLSVNIADPKLCRRYIGRIIENIKVGPSPEWLSRKLETLGQRSINNVVDATNFVMLELGQPMHAFDADKLGSSDIVIDVKNAKAGQTITTLDKKEVNLDESILLITDGKNPLAIAGVKGGNYAELDQTTTNLVLESANFNPTLIRKTAQKIKIQTDASKRYENDITPELCGEAMDILTKLVVEIAGTKDTKVGEAIDNYPRKANPYKLGISAKEASDIIGVNISDKDIGKIFDRFGFEWKKVKPIDEVLKLAPTLVGVPYKLGSSISYDAPKLFDCSSFVSYVFAQVGVQIPRVCIDQYVFGKAIEEKNLVPGDVVFFSTGSLENLKSTFEYLPGTPIKEDINHNGIYVGEGKIIHASGSKKSVLLESIVDMKKEGRIKDVCYYRRLSDNTERFVVTAPAERLDLRIKEDLAEEIGRIYGYEKIRDIAIPKPEKPAAVDAAFYYKEKIRRILYQEGFSEVMNYTFVGKGEIELANPSSPEKKFLRTNLADGLKDSLAFNARYADLVDMPQIRVFEFGHVFAKSGESNHFALGIQTPGAKKPSDAKDLEAILAILSEKLGVPLKKMNKEENIAEFDLSVILRGLPEPKEYDFSEIGNANARFKKISPYPYMVRDIAVFTPEGTKPEAVFSIIQKEAGELMVKNRLFDVFTKKFPDGSSKTSYAYRLIFQSYERTLSDEEINKIMEKIAEKMNTHAGWQVR